MASSATNCRDQMTVCPLLPRRLILTVLPTILTVLLIVHTAAAAGRRSHDGGSYITSGLKRRRVAVPMTQPQTAPQAGPQI